MNKNMNHWTIIQEQAKRAPQSESLYEKSKQPWWRLRTVMLYVVILSLSLTTFSGCTAQKDQQQNDFPSQSEKASTLINTQGTKYTMYIGLNDKETYEQIVSIEEAEQIVTEIALEYVGGFTLTQGKGAYKDEDNVITYENSLIIAFTDASEDDMKAIMDDILVSLNQNAVLIETQSVIYTFYEGEGETP
jgi:uncharacterized membrane-anchored protein YitT (DUF2179 family)